jgi:hypothetical protein
MPPRRRCGLLRLLAAQPLLAALCSALAPAAAPSTVGRFSSFTNALPNGQLPSVPLLGNGALGVLLDGRADGGGRIDAWLGSASFWSCGACTTLAKGCCRLVSLGALRLQPAADAALGALAFAAEQRIGAGQLSATLTTARGGVATVLVYEHPSDRNVVLNISWAPAAGDPPALKLDVSVWAEPASGNGASPAPASAGCADPASGASAACNPAAAGASAQAIVVSRKAATAANSPLPIWAAWAAVMSGGAPGANFSSAGNAGATASVAVTASAPLSVRLAEYEGSGSGGSNDPSSAAVSQAFAADAGVIAADAALFWTSFWGRSSVSLPGQPGLEALWNGAAYALAATSSADANVPPPGLYGVWATSDGCNWNGDYTLDYNAEVSSTPTTPAFSAFTAP